LKTKSNPSASAKANLKVVSFARKMLCRVSKKIKFFFLYQRQWKTTQDEATMNENNLQLHFLLNSIQKSSTNHTQDFAVQYRVKCKTNFGLNH